MRGMPTEEERSALIKQVAEATPAEVADALLEQETALAALQGEIVRLDEVIETINVTIQPVVARTGPTHRTE